MKLTRYAPFLLIATVCAAQEQQQQPPTEITLDFGVDEYVYEPKFNLGIGVRGLSGAKTAFGGAARISTAFVADSLTENILRSYHDGTVSPDGRTDGLGSLLPRDGYTNTWSYLDPKQATADGRVAMHTYTAEVQAGQTMNKDANSSYGVELTVSRDMGKLFGRFPWTLSGGFSVNDIRSKVTSLVNAKITTTTDTYAVKNGVAVPTAPYTAPSTTTITPVDGSGNQIVNGDGTAQTITVDNTVMLGGSPLIRTVTSSTNNTAVTNTWKLHGAYYTFRAGPVIYFPITSRLRATLSAGPALVYAGSTYSVDEVFLPDTGAEVTETLSDGVSKFLPGFYVDANMEFVITERAGLYLGGVYQSTGHYEQEIGSGNGRYTSTIDFSHMQGIRGGMTFRF